MRRARWVALGVAALGGIALLWPRGEDLPDARALDLVKAYNARKIESYRTGDAELMRGLVGPVEDRKTAALIATKVEAGIFLDASLDELRLLRVARPEVGIIEVFTAEKWSYMDRRIGSGAQVGAASSDGYRMAYHLERIGGRWVVARISFVTPPEVGRARAIRDRPGATVRHGGGETR